MWVKEQKMFRAPGPQACSNLGSKLASDGGSTSLGDWRLEGGAGDRDTINSHIESHRGGNAVK